jgi:oligopeptide transport system substrate-binding protein
MKLLRYTVLALSLVLGLTSSTLAEVVLHRGNSKEPDTLDPHRAAGVWEDEIIGDMFLGLTTEAINGDIIPGSAESWTISDDGLVYTFTLRDALLWSDGVPVTASDFVFGMRRIMDPETAARYASLLFPIKNARAINMGEMSPDEIGVVALGSQRVEITLENPVSFFTQLLSHYTTFPVPQHTFAMHGEDWVKAGNMVTNGAYVLQEWVANSHVKVAKNTKFYDAANVAIDTVFYYPIEDSRTGLRMFETGELDTNLMTEGFPSTMLEEVTRRLPDEARVVPSLGNRFLPMNTSKPPFNDKRVRKAVSMLVDREIINDRVVSVGARSAYAFVPPETANHQAGAQVDFVSMAMPERIAEAKRLLALAGYSEDNPLRFELSYRGSYDNTRRLSAIAAMFLRAGVIAEIAAYDSRISYSKMDQGDYEMGDGGWAADYNDPYNFLYLLLCDSGPMNWARYCNPGFDKLVNQAAVTLDMKKRAGLMSQAEQIMLDDHPVIMLDYATNRILGSKRIRGFVDNISNKHRTRFMWISDI